MKPNKLSQQFSTTASPPVEELVERYEIAGGRRDRFLWKWVATVFRQGITLSCVEEEYLDTVIDLKVLLTVIDAIVDDAADYYKDRELINRAYMILFYGKSFSEKKLILFKDLWDYILREMKGLPRFEEFFPIFEYDIRQMFNAMYYSYLANTKPETLNLKEAEIYVANNMIIFPYIDIDLMASPSFDITEYHSLEK